MKTQRISRYHQLQHEHRSAFECFRGETILDVLEDIHMAERELSAEKGVDHKTAKKRTLKKLTD